MSSKFDEESLVRAFSNTLSRLPRIKGFGLLIAQVANWFKDRPIIIEKRALGSMMRLRTDDLIGRMMIFSPNYFDVHERRVIRSIVGKGDYVVDVGANIGVYTLFLSRLVGSSGRVDAIEAEAQNAKELRYNLNLNEVANVKVFQCGVSDKDETLELLLNTTGNAGGHSFFDQSHIPEPDTQDVCCVPLSRIVNGERPKFVKLDIEGFEYRVLRRFFDDMPETQWPKYLMLEDNPARRENDAVELCIERGYTLLKAFGPNVFLQLSRADQK